MSIVDHLYPYYLSLIKIIELYVFYWKYKIYEIISILVKMYTETRGFKIKRVS